MRRVVTVLIFGLLSALPACAGFAGGLFDTVQTLRDVRIIQVVPGSTGIIFAPGVIVAEDQGGVRYDVYVNWFDSRQANLVPAAGDVCTIAYAWAYMKGDFAPAATERQKAVREGRSATCGAVIYSFPRLSDD